MERKKTDPNNLISALKDRCKVIPISAMKRVANKIGDYQRGWPHKKARNVKDDAS